MNSNNRLPQHRTGLSDDAVSRRVLYVAHPLSPTEDEIAAAAKSGPLATRQDAERCARSANIGRALRWLAWLRQSFPSIAFIAPWIASVMSGDDDSDPAQREANLVDDCAVVVSCDGIVLVGGRISSGMERERTSALDAGLDMHDMTHLGDEPPDGRHSMTWSQTGLILAGRFFGEEEIKR